MIQYNVTFKHLVDRLNLVDGPELDINEIECGLGSIYPMPGGLKENAYWFLGEDVFMELLWNRRNQMTD